MTDKRRKLLGRAAMVFAGLFVLYLLADFIVLSPAAEMDARAQRLRKEIRQLDRLNDRETRYLALLREHAAKTYGTDPAKVSEEIRVRLDEMRERAHLRLDGTAQPVTGESKPNAYREIGWRISLVGSLEQAVDMLYLLQEDPYLHRIEGLKLMPHRDGRGVDLAFRYMTIVLDEKLLKLHRNVGDDKKTIIVKTAEADEPLPLPKLAGSEDRSEYGLISSRNMFRPYIKKPPPPKPKPQPKPQPTQQVASPPPPPPPPDYSRYRLISLSQWGRQQDISVKDSKTGEVQRYNPGDDLAGGSIVMVDYRQMPQPDDPELLSPSRLIMKVGEDYFAVELGTNFAQKHPLAVEMLPPELQNQDQ